MKSRNNVQINLSIPEHYRNLLRRMAAEKMLDNPGKVVTGSSIATEILLKALQGMEDKKEGENTK